MLDKVRTYFVDLKNEYPILRGVFGVSFALIYSTTLGYPAPHLTAIFALMFLGPGKQALGLKKEIIIPLAIYVLGSIGVIVGNQLIDYPFVMLPLLALAIFWSFRLVQIPAPVRLLFLMLFVLIPFNSITANAIGGIVLSALLFNLIIALVIVKIAFLLFPDPAKIQNIAQKKETPAAKNPLNLDKVAVNGLLVVFPIVCLFYTFNAQVGMLTLVFTVILGFDPFIHQSKKGLVIIGANILGGVFGIIAYQILITVPNYFLYILLTISIAFFFITNLFSKKKIAPAFATSFNTFFVIMGIISTSTNQAGSELWSRLAQIGVAIVYTVLAYKVLNVFNNPKNSNINE